MSKTYAYDWSFVLEKPMEFGALEDFKNVDFSFKKSQFYSSQNHNNTNADNTNIDKTTDKTDNNKTKWFLGCPVWTHKGLIKRITAPNSKKGTPLEAYSRVFNSIELNSSFYNLPSEVQVHKWREQTPESFLFCPKAPKSITFNPLHKIPVQVLDHYFSCLSHFKDQLGESFLQFSPYITPEHKKYLFLILEALPKEFNFSIELRHPDWFSNPTLLDNLCNYLAKKNIGLVLTDTPGRRDVLSMRFTCPRILVRFKGNNSHATDYERLDNWLKLLNSQQPFEEIYFFHHHSDEQYCADTLKYLRENLEPHVQQSIPEIFIRQDEEQISLL